MAEIFDVINSNFFMPNSQVEVVENKQHEFRLIGSQRKQAGHTLFSLNLKTGEIKVAPVVRSDVVDFRTRMPVHRDRIVVEPHCVYRQALNKKNFIKKLKRENIIISRVVRENDIIVK